MKMFEWLKGLISSFFNKVSSLEKYQKIFWYTSGAIMLMWIAYNTGSVVSTNMAQAENGGTPQGQMNMDEFSKNIKNERLGILYINPDNVKFKNKKNEVYIIPDFKDKINNDILSDITSNNIEVKGNIKLNVIPQYMGSTQLLFTLIIEFLLKIGLFGIYILIFFFIFKQMRPSKAGIFGKRFRRINKDDSMLVKISDVAGNANAKQEVMEIVDYLKSPEKYEKVGAKIPKGILLYGPPGTGKTMMAKAIAGEADANFLTQSADSFMNTYVGQGAAGVRSLFEEARKIKPCVVFIDEIDAFGTSRDNGGNDERIQTLNALLSQMDGFSESNEGIVVIAATNRKEQIDEALLRPGRFDRKVYISLPNIKDRIEILKVYIDKKPTHDDVNVKKIAERTGGFSGADLSNLVNEAAVEAARKGKLLIDMNDFDSARERVMMGVKDNRKISLTDKKFVTYHELGHAALKIAIGGKVEKVSVESRGMALGVTVMENETEDENEKVLRTEEDIFNEMKVLMGGRAAEEVFCHKVTNGASDDIRRASMLAREVVRYYGFENNGPYSPEHEVLIGEVEEKARKLVERAYSEAKKYLEEHKDEVNELYSDLILKNELTGSEIEKVFKK